MYLSIDMDFFNDQDESKTESYLTKLFTEARKQKIPCTAVMNHHHMLQFVNASSAINLINMDMHSDLDYDDVKELNCGTWVTYVKWRQHGVYTWLHKHSLFDGDCSFTHEQGHLFKASKRFGKKGSGWHTVKHVNIKLNPRVKQLLTFCTDIGLCLSPSYVDNELEPIFRKLIKDFKIPYYRGRRNEYCVGQYVCPPRIGK